MPESKAILQSSVDLALASGYSMSHRMSLHGVQGHYICQGKSCNPLETLVLGQAVAHCLNADIADALGVSLEWVDGFLDAFGDRTTSPWYSRLNITNTPALEYLLGRFEGLEAKGWIQEMEVAHGQR